MYQIHRYWLKQFIRLYQEHYVIIDENSFQSIASTPRDFLQKTLCEALSIVYNNNTFDIYLNIVSYFAMVESEDSLLIATSLHNQEIIAVNNPLKSILARIYDLPNFDNMKFYELEAMIVNIGDFVRCLTDPSSSTVSACSSEVASDIPASIMRNPRLGTCIFHYRVIWLELRYIDDYVKCHVFVMFDQASALSIAAIRFEEIDVQDDELIRRSKIYRSIKPLPDRSRGKVLKAEVEGEAAVKETAETVIKEEPMNTDYMEVLMEDINSMLTEEVQSFLQAQKQDARPGSINPSGHPPPSEPATHIRFEPKPFSSSFASSFDRAYDSYATGRPLVNLRPQVDFPSIEPDDDFLDQEQHGYRSTSSSSMNHDRHDSNETTPNNYESECCSSSSSDTSSLKRKHQSIDDEIVPRQRDDASSRAPVLISSYSSFIEQEVQEEDEADQLTVTRSRPTLARSINHVSVDAAMRAMLEYLPFDMIELWIPMQNPNNPSSATLYFAGSSSNIPSLAPWSKYSRSFTFDSNVGLPGRVSLKNHPETHRDLAQLGSPVFLRVQGARSLGIHSSVGVPIASTVNHHHGVALFTSTQVFDPSDDLVNHITHLLGNLRIKASVRCKRDISNITKSSFL
jgi:hypothetical protein